MVQYYQLAGAKVGSHYLAMAVLGTVFGGVSLAMRGGEKKKEQGPPINASSPDEENFIKDFLKNAEAESKGKSSAAH